MSRKGQLCFIGRVSKAGEQEAKVQIFPEFRAGLKNVEKYSHLIILYWMHLRNNEKTRQTLLVFPRRHAVNVETGVFACRSPDRPNPIGLCVVELLKMEKCVLVVKGLDALEGTPIIDIKPYIPKTDSVQNAQVPEWVNRKILKR